jgi:hypothetical protein
MIRRSKIAIVSLGALALLGSVTAARAQPPAHDQANEGAEEDEFPFSKAPAAVQDTMRRVAGSAVPDELDKEVENGMVVYQGEYRNGSSESSIKVAENGELLEVKKEVAAAHLPAAVKATVDKVFAGASIKKAREVYLKGAATPGYYEVKMAGTQKKRIKVRPTGEVIG